MFMQETPSSMVNVHKKMPKNTFFFCFLVGQYLVQYVKLHKNIHIYLARQIAKLAVSLLISVKFRNALGLLGTI